jgi:DNA-binding SARP family transcriptional activator/tetratricopeptide (TPR) repeat protein
MSEVERNRGLSVPDLGATVPRDRLLRLYERIRPPVAVLVAPAAYGKSVLATQLARAGCVESVLWVRVPQGCTSSVGILSAAHGVLVGALERPAQGLPSFPQSMTGHDLLDRVESAALEACGDGACVVLDNIDAGESAAVQELLAAIEAHRGSLSWILTVRAASIGAGTPLGAWLVGPRELLLDDEEAERVVLGVLGHLPEPAALSELIGASGRQAGVLSVLARYAASRPGTWRGSSASQGEIMGMLSQLANTQLSVDQRLALQCMALLGEGSAEDLRALPGCQVTPRDMQHIAAAIPMVRADLEGNRTPFAVHEIVQRTFGNPEGARADDIPLLDAILQMLATRGDEDRILGLACGCGDPTRASHWLSALGFGALRRGRAGSLLEGLAGVPTLQLVSNPRLLLLRAAAHLDVGDKEMALRDSRLARELAEQDDDRATLAGALLVLAQAAAGSQDFVLAAAYLDRAVELGDSALDPVTQAHLCGRRLLIRALLGDREKYLEAEVAAQRLAAAAPAGSVQATLTFLVSTAKLAYRGDWAGSVGPLSLVSRSRDLPSSERLAAAYNYVACLLETGRLSQAARALDEYRADADAAPNTTMALGVLAAQALIDATTGDGSTCLDQVDRTASAEWDAGERVSATTEAMSGSAALLGNRMFEDALGLAERADAWAQEMSAPVMAWESRILRASALLGLGDETLAARLVREVEPPVRSSLAARLQLMVDLVLAEVQCRGGDTAAATERLREHAPYVLAESANWMCAMYVRAFPRLLGPLAAAVGARDLPIHLIRLIPPVYAAEAIGVAGLAVSPDDRETLSRRHMGVPPVVFRVEASAVPVLHVRLFGGLEVQRAGGPLADRDWRKRKARLMFAMLATRCGKDVPRDQLIEYLWPGMGEQTSLNNFYVVWSSMRRAIAPGLARGEACPYVDHRGGVCRAVAGAVLTDLGEFEVQVAVAARARQTGDEDAELEALQGLWDLYRGDLLPGEAYDDWFSTLRDRCRHEFEDAMLRAAEILEGRRDARGALTLVRRALEHDPWREDLYQAALRLQIAAGQRSAAIETYLMCRTRLVDDLGIDPSSDTSRLYEQVLCMDEPVRLPEARGD